MFTCFPKARVCLEPFFQDLEFQVHTLLKCPLTTAPASVCAVGGWGAAPLVSVLDVWVQE